MQPCERKAETHNSATNDRFIARCTMLSGSRDVQIFVCLHTDLCNVPLFLMPKLPLQIKFTKARPSFYLMNKIPDTKTSFKLLDSSLFVRRVQANPLILVAQETALD